jgi:hypothetical protein
MKGELETICQQALDHHFQMFKLRLSGLVGLAGHVVLFRFEPRRSTDDLTGMKIVS